MSFLALWGAGLSTILAVVKLYEVWRDRFRIDIGYNFTSDPYQGNKIFIRNLSSKPFILGYWELMHLSKSWPKKEFHEFASPLDEAHDIKIEALSSTVLHFSEGEHFNWSSKEQIYIRLHIAGRRPVVKKVYG